MAEVPWCSLDSLGDLELLGEGGEAEVFSCGAHGHLVFKRFRDSVASEISSKGLRDTIELQNRLTGDDRDFVLKRTVWPKTVVMDRERLIGYLMDRIGTQFFCQYGRRGGVLTSAQDWNKLTYRDRVFANPNLETTMVNLSEPDRSGDLRGLLRDVAKLFDILHGAGVVIGDVSGRNLMWTCTPRPEVLLIDCDGLRARGSRAVTLAKQSPDWVDPVHQNETDIDSDLYKLALAMYRAYFSAEVALPIDHSTSPSDPFDADLLERARRGTATSGRTTAAEWVNFFDQFESQREERLRQSRIAARGQLDWRDGLHEPTFVPPPIRKPEREPMDWKTN